MTVHTTKAGALLAFRRYLSATTGLPLDRVLVTNAKRVARTQPFILSLGAVDAVVGYADQHQVEATDNTTLRERHRLTVLLEARGPGMDDLVQRARAAFNADFGAADDLRDAGVAPETFGEGTDVSRWVATTIEPRTQYTVTMNYAFELTDQGFEEITRVEYDVTITGPQGTDRATAEADLDL